jgi:hypothetical protein
VVVEERDLKPSSRCCWLSHELFRGTFWKSPFDDVLLGMPIVVVIVFGENASDVTLGRPSPRGRAYQYRCSSRGKTRNGAWLGSFYAKGSRIASAAVEVGK